MYFLSNILAIKPLAAGCPEYFLITEHMPLGNVAEYLSQHELTDKLAVYFAKSIVDGLCYLHAPITSCLSRKVKVKSH